MKVETTQLKVTKENKKFYKGHEFYTIHKGFKNDYCTTNIYLLKIEW